VKIGLHRNRLPWLVSAFVGFAAGVTARSEAQRRLSGGHRRLPGEPHPYVPEAHWPGSCWCGRPKGAPVHQSRLAAASGAQR
jgi:hypothetical protein